MTSFAELTKQVHLINDLILADMTCEDFDSSKEALTFSKHLLATKYWFARISYTNKKRYLLALLHDLRSAWALSLLLKSMWNCRPKDAVLSVSERHVYTSYDQVPMDHNRTAMPGHTLAQVMKNDRIWFHALNPERQALMLSELMTVAGGPGMWKVLRVAQRLFERNRDLMLKNIQECIVVERPVTQRSPLSEYLFVPWLGAALRGLFLRQAPTAGALLYTVVVINGDINPLFLTAFSFLFLLEARLWLEIARLVRARWERRQHGIMSRDSEYEVQTLWSNDDVQSIEVRNYVY